MGRSGATGYESLPASGGTIRCTGCDAKRGRQYEQLVNRHLDRRLQQRGELAGMAANAVPALRRLLDRGDFDLPASGIAARDEFTRRVDQVRTWADECAEVDPEHPFVPGPCSTART